MLQLKRQNTGTGKTFLTVAQIYRLLESKLVRRTRSLSGLGMSWTKKDFAHSVLIWLLGFGAYCVVYWGIYLAGLTVFSYSAGGARVGQVLFGGGITFMTFIFQFINPFYEELIVRAYLMTEI